MVLSDFVWMHHLAFFDTPGKKESNTHFLSYITLLAVGLFDALNDLSYLQNHQLGRIHVRFIFTRTKNDFLGEVGGGVVHEKCLLI